MTGPKRVTEKQLAANRANALRSTGTRTPQGRGAVRYNALKHGILAQAVIPEALEPFESRADFNALLATLHDEFAPGNSIEELLVEQIAITYWRLSRLERLQRLRGGEDVAPPMHIDVSVSEVPPHDA